MFVTEQAVAVIEYAHDTYGSSPEFLWPRFPGNAILRRADTGKWFAALLVVSRRKLGQDSDEMVEILNLRFPRELLPGIVDGKRFFPGWHMSKKTWYTVILDGSVSVEELFYRLDMSYSLAAK